MNIDELMRDIASTFPLVKRTQRHFRWDHTDSPHWLIGAPAEVRFVDGLPIFSEFMSGEPTHDGGVHTAFIAWVELRGFYLERVDSFWWLPTTLPTAEDLDEMQRAAETASKQQAPRDPRDCPF